MTDDELDAMIERGRNYVGGLRGENELKVGPAMSSYAIEQLVSGVEALRAERDRLREALLRAENAVVYARQRLGYSDRDNITAQRLDGEIASIRQDRRAMIDAAGEDKA